MPKKMIKKKTNTVFTIAVYITCLFGACTGEEEILIPSTYTQLQAPTPHSPIKGFYLLNEGNMGSNKCTLDYFDYTTGYYRKNIYAETNPSVVLELGDVGNDIRIYGSKLYAVINCSNFIEVMDAHTARHLGTIEIPNCRYITFHEGKAYVSSYAGPVQINPNARLGYVAEIDTTTFDVLRTATVGYQPEEMLILNNKLYVANSGGYRFPNYDTTISVVDLNTFTEVKKIEVAINLHRMEVDRYGYMYVSSRGDYYGEHSDIYVIDSRTEMVVDTLGIPASEFCISGDSLYVYSVEWNWNTQKNEVTYTLIHTRTREVITHNFITDGAEKQIKIPYGIAVNPITKEIYVTDAKNYVHPGTLYCFTPEGKKKWSVTTGDIPAHFVFLYK